MDDEIKYEEIIIQHEDNNNNIDTSYINTTNDTNNDDFIRKSHIIESILFTMGDSVELSTLALALNCDKNEAKKLCEFLKEKYTKEHFGMKIIRLENKYQMVSSDEYFDNLVIVAANPKKPILTDAVIETLAIIAYKQPITKSEIEKIRGVSSEHTVSRLLEYKLIEEAGRLDAPGRPITFKTNENFLRRFGIASIDDLPILSSERESEIQSEVQEEIKSSLGEAVLIDDNSNDISKNTDNKDNNGDITNAKNIEI
ncbi:MAG: SMC-Scp complex subunit ScpB [Eubacteriales bacterium]|nr:SMC-Scp complex subunit ScpB [Eubacteriales bacterium]